MLTRCVKLRYLRNRKIDRNVAFWCRTLKPVVVCQCFPASQVCSRKPNSFLCCSTCPCDLLWAFHVPHLPREMRHCCHGLCKRRPSFNVEGSITAAYCRQHAKDGMINVCIGRCSYDSCTKVPSFNVEGSKKAIYCKQHAQDSMVDCLLYTSPSPRDRQKSRMPSSA